ncbi:growth hormone secretagogue receptor type 1 isoform X1 [Drosophila busckii]|uniref:growth hormone secretagogue receptor type 1 isoform X1 n=1 Tax=Drosophila busckii TaxID=30019 RepID=UPI00083EBD85|nr:growth hormone secretagogue receptor type 1 isoform X1 [Drosophila busckii]XP_017847305.1 growth hormone secretagogue receptor type 1 isoform X1 [Drosophila busckii]
MLHAAAVEAIPGNTLTLTGQNALAAFESTTQLDELSRGAADSSNGADNPTYSIPAYSAAEFANTSASASSAGATHNASEESTDQLVPQIPSYIRTTAMFFCIIIMLLGVVGNVMVPIVIVKTKDMRNSTNIFLTNLSIADLLVLLVCTPTVLVEVNTRPETWVLGHEMCKAVPFVELTVAHASVLTILAISFERYYAICEPLKAGYVCTKARAILICVLAWGIAALFTSPIVAISNYSVEPYGDGTDAPVCTTAADNFWSILYFVGSITIFFFLPFGILVLLYAAIAYKLLRPNSAFHRPTSPQASATALAAAAAATAATTTPATAAVLPSNKGNSHQQSNGMRKHRKQVIFMLVAVVSSFFVCLLPFRAFTLWVITASAEDLERLGISGYYNLLYFSRFMLYLNSAMNPILYNLMSSKFRSGFWRLLLSCLGLGQHTHHHHHHQHYYRAQAAGQSLCHTTTRRRDNDVEGVGAAMQSTGHAHRTLRREATFLINSISTSSGTERNTSSSNWRSNSLSTSTGVTERERGGALGAAIIGATAATVSAACLEERRVSNI